MMEHETQPDVIDVLPLTVVLWLGYLLALALIDRLFFPRPVFPPAYYLINGGGALLVLLLTLWDHGRAWMGRAFLPLVIVLMALVPLLLAQVLSRYQPPEPSSGPEALLVRTMPLLLMALIVTAWHYGWRSVLLFSGGIALFSAGLHLAFFRRGGAPLLPPLTVVAIQTVSFLLVGYFISTLIRRLKRQQEVLAQTNQQLTDYATTLEELTISRERNRMARELHDTLAHTLSALSVQLETVKAYWEVDPDAAHRLVDRSLTATRSGLQETRRALKSLRASPLDDLGLALALRQLANETAQRARLQLDLAVPERLPTLAPAVEQCMYRVAQEATANVAHHANASRLTLHLTVHDDGVSLLVRDDGRGFDPNQTVSAGHFGLAGMRERAVLVGGEVHITSEPGAGTTVQLSFRQQVVPGVPYSIIEDGCS
jgi:signal transduction histidine kinase